MNTQGDKRKMARQRLILATIECIEDVGIGRATVRVITERAGVNIAAVGYYFGSKDNLITATLEHTLDHMLADARAYLERIPQEPKAALADLLAYLLDGALRYPRLTQAHMHDTFITGEYAGGFPQRFATIQDDLERALQAVLPGCGREERRRVAARALSAVFFPAFFSGLFGPHKLFSTPKKRRQYAVETAVAVLSGSGSSVDEGA